MAHTVTLEPDNTTFTVDDDETILAAAKRQGLNLPHSCQNGICGQCKADQLSGKIIQETHAEQALPSEELAQGKILMCCCKTASDVTLKIPGYNGSKLPSVKTLPVRVASVEFKHDVAIVTLTLPKAPPFIFLAGQYIDIMLKNNQCRSYSIASATNQNGLIELHIRKREGGLFTGMLFGENTPIKEKTIMRIRGPLGTFTLKNSNKPIIMLATGTGFAPIRSLLLQLIADKSQRSVHLYWGARQEADLYCLSEAAALVAQLSNSKFTPVLSRPNSVWQGERGYIQSTVARDYPNLADYEVYACGSTAMINGAQQHLEKECSLPPDAFLSDAFSPAV